MRIIKADLAGSALSTFCGQIFDLLYQQCDAACVSTQRKDESSHLLSSMLERTTGIEPASSAWEADILPMNYVRVCICLASVLPTPAACKSLCKNISPDAERLCLRLTACQSPSHVYLSCISSADACGLSLKVPRAKALHFLA